MRDSSWDWATLVVKLVAPRNMHCDRVGVEKNTLFISHQWIKAFAQS